MIERSPITQSPISQYWRAFWEGLTRPHGATAAAALTLVALFWLAMALSSTEARVRATDFSRWVRPSDGGWTYLNAVTIQGAARHVPASERAVVLIGPSHLVRLLPSREELAEAYVPAGVPPVRILGLAADGLSLEECASVVDKFGADFDGWFVIHVNRHTMARGMEDMDNWKGKGGHLVQFYSNVLKEERVRSGRAVPRQWGIPLLDFPTFYLQSLGGWRSVLFPWKLGRAIRMADVVQAHAPTPEEIAAAIPVSASGAQSYSFDLLARVADRLRANGRARLAIVEMPFADEIEPEVQTAAWRAARATFTAQRKAWSEAHGVPWLDVTDKLQAHPEDFVDPRHFRSPKVSARFTTAVLQWLAAIKS